MYDIINVISSIKVVLFIRSPVMRCFSVYGISCKYLDFFCKKSS